jgi:hypothetical protein
MTRPFIRATELASSALAELLYTLDQSTIVLACYDAEELSIRVRRLEELASSCAARLEAIARPTPRKEIDDVPAAT